MLKGVHLTLMMGPLVPVPVPQAVLDALTSVTVTTDDSGKSGFQLSFTLSNRSPLHTLFLLTGGSPVPILRVIIVVTLNGTPNVLMDGSVTNHQIAPGSDAGHSTLTLTGEDLTVLMDQIDFSGFPYPAVPAEGRVALLLLKYAFLGIVPLIIPSVLVDVVIPTNQIPRHKGTDLKYIKYLAQRVGYVFYLEPGPVPGINFAYWGPQIKIGVPQPALNINMDAHTNVEALSFTFDNNQNGIPTVFIYNEITKIPLLDSAAADHAVESAAGSDSTDSNAFGASERQPVQAPRGASDHAGTGESGNDGEKAGDSEAPLVEDERRRSGTRSGCRR